jgi:MFS family permease
MGSMEGIRLSGQAFMNTKKITILTSIGSGLEYYDFVIYAMLAGYIANQFFPKTNYYTNLMGAFSVFAIGYFIRPIGGVIFGSIGDHFGRKKTFLISMFLMAISTFSIGLLPTYSKIGITSTIIFTLLRLIQGIAIGAELPGSLTFLTEHVSNNNRGTHCGFMVASVGVGVMIGSFVICVLSNLLTNIQMLTWGWRIPFLIGGGLAVIGYFIRKQTRETLYFIAKTKEYKHVLLELFQNHLKQVICGIGIILFPACFIIFILVMPVYLHMLFHYSTHNIYLAITLGYIWSALLIPPFGWLSDRIGRKKLFLLSIFLMMSGNYLLFSLLNIKTTLSLYVFILIYQLIVAVMAANYFPMLAEAFPTSVRYTGVAFCYNVAYVLASLTPLLIGCLYKSWGHSFISITAIFSALSFITLVSTIAIQNNMSKEPIPT